MKKILIGIGILFTVSCCGNNISNISRKYINIEDVPIRISIVPCDTICDFMQEINLFFSIENLELVSLYRYYKIKRLKINVLNSNFFLKTILI